MTKENKQETTDYKVFLTYRNEKTLNIFIPSEDLDIFLNCLNSSKMYTNQHTKVSFWTSKDSLEYMVIYPMTAEDMEAMRKTQQEKSVEAPSDS